MSRRTYRSVYIPINYSALDTGVPVDYQPSPRPEPKKKVRAIRSDIPSIDWAIERASRRGEEEWFLEELKEIGEARCDPIRSERHLWLKFCQDLLYPSIRGDTYYDRHPEEDKSHLIKPVGEAPDSADTPE